jgi:outer membrane protein assembly factor BamB
MTHLTNHKCHRTNGHTRLDCPGVVPNRPGAARGICVGICPMIVSSSHSGAHGTGSNRVCDGWSGGTDMPSAAEEAWMATRIASVCAALLAGALLTSVEAVAEIQPGGATMPNPLRFRAGPYAQFLSPDSAAVFWDTREPAAATLAYGKAGQLTHCVEVREAKASQHVVLTGLEPRTEYAYQIKAIVGGVERTSRTFTLDTTFNYTVQPMPQQEHLYPEDDAGSAYAEAARHILSETHVAKGYCLVYGFGTGRLAWELAKRSELIVIGFDEDASRVAAARRRLYDKGIYGTRITVRQVPSLASLPVASCMANLVVSETLLAGGALPGRPAEVSRILRPAGGVACLGRPAGGPNPLAKDAIKRWFEAASLSCVVSDTSTGTWAKLVRGPLPGAGRWTHQYGDADNSANSGEALGGATGTCEMEVQWIGQPGGDFGIDRNPRMPAPLSIGGRLFHQGMNRVIALDAYNGAVLWSLEIPDLRRVNVPRDASNWCADEDSIYAAVGDACWRLDAATGRRRSLYSVSPDGSGETHDWGYVARVGNLLYGSKVKKGSSFTEFWGHAAWYDDPTGPGSGKVCSEGLFALDKETGRPVWTYSNGAIINTTIVVGDDRVWFVECRHPEIKASKTGRIESTRLWSDRFLVALDAGTGRKLWEQPTDTAQGTVVFFMVYANKSLVIMASTGGKYHLYAYDAADGRLKWQADHKWTGDNHSGHMQHPVVMGDRVYQEPCVYDLNTGQRISDKMGRHEGCATYAGTNGALLYRGAGRQISLWDIRTGAISGWANLRPSCWLSVIPAGGMVLAPEGGAGCSCGNWLETSVGFIPKQWQHR